MLRELEIHGLLRMAGLGFLRRAPEGDREDLEPALYLSARAGLSAHVAFGDPSEEWRMWSSG